MGQMSKSEGLMSGRHQTESIQVNLTATIIREEDGGIDSFDARIVSLSPGGMGLRADRPIPPDSSVQLTITFIDQEGKKHTESVEGWLVWQDQDAHDYLLGVIFPEINERENPKLISYFSSMDQVE